MIIGYKILNGFLKLLGFKRRFVEFQTSFPSHFSICYAITVCNENYELYNLLSLISRFKREQDFVLVQKDQNKVTAEVLNVISQFKDIISEEIEYPLNDDFGSFKNNLLKHVSSDYVFQLDADELPSSYLLENLPSFLASNPDIDAFRLPRINLICDDNQSLIGWNELASIDESLYHHFPDYQYRIFKNSSSIYWHKKVHEVIQGFNTYSLFPKNKKYALLHSKKKSKQIRQWEYYDRLKKAINH